MFAAKNELLTMPSGGYRISRSLRFRSLASANLSRTPSLGNRTTWTWSAWIKRGTFSAAQQFIFDCSASQSYVQFGPSENIRVGFYSTNSSTGYVLTTNAVFRDPSAWYHCVISVDTTQSTPANRVRIYVNSVEQTTTGTQPAQNDVGQINTVAVHRLGSYDGTQLSLDGYLAEVNFIDGSALLPTDFGAYDTNGVWQPKAYAGSYSGTNSFYLQFSLNTTSSFSGTFDGTSKYLTIADNAAFDLAASDFTAEAWLYPTSSIVSTAANVFNQSTQSAASNTALYFGAGNDGISLYLSTSGSSWTNNITAGSALPLNAWSHVVWQRRSNTLEAYLNGVKQTVTSGTAAFSGTVFNSSRNIEIAIQNASASTGFVGQISNLRLVKGSAVYTSNFTPSVAPLTNITNTSLLTLQNSTLVDNSSNVFSITNNGSVAFTSATPFVANYSGDASGNNNSWVGYNLNVTSSGTTYDSMLDSPTNATGDIGNYCTWNPVYKNATVATTDGNLSANSGASAAVHRMIFGTQGFTTASYFEITTSGGTTAMVSIVGVGQATTGTADGVYVGSYSKSFGLGYATNAAYWYVNGATNANGAATNLVDGTWGFAVDPANGKAWVRNTLGNWIGGGDPAAGTLPTFTWTSDGLPWFPVMSFYNVATTFVVILNAGQRSYSFTVPSGFSALNTQNLPTPTIANGAQYMAAVTYTGNGGTQTVTTTSTNSGNNPNGTTFQPDFVWVKDRVFAYNHGLYDAVRGVQNWISSSSTSAENAFGTGELTAFNSNGFTLVNSANYENNKSSDTYIGWQWKAGGAPTVDNTAGAGNVPTAGSVKINGANSSATLAGSIAATRLSANTSAGFSVVTFTQLSAAPYVGTVGHGLNAIPSMVIIKDRSAANGWLVYHSSIGATQYLVLNTPAAAVTGSNAFNNTGPTSSVFTTAAGSTYWGNAGATAVAYCFAPVAGYSAFGSYTANASTDGPMVFTNFRPRYVLLKNTTRVLDWITYDSSRDLYNTETQQLYPNLSTAETAGANIDFLSNGFKIRAGSASGINHTSGDVYIYAAFCELPFKIARAR